MKHAMYYTGSEKYLNPKQNPYEMLQSWGLRLRKAMGEKEILPRNLYKGGELRVPTYRSYAEALDRSPWTCYDKHGMTLYVQPYNDIYDGWDNGERRHGLMARSYSPYEYAFKYWDDYTHEYSPDLLDNGTFGLWLELLPEPAFFLIEGNNSSSVRIQWASEEPRVHRAKEMGRYLLPTNECFAQANLSSWRLSRAEAYVMAWEKMAANEPEDRHEADILKDQAIIDELWNRPKR